MAERESFSDILRDERLRLGLTIDQATAATRIRRQILIDFENANFDDMPPVGYAKNMIASYARWLGLDPQTLVESYLADYDVYQASIAPDPGYGTSGGNSDSFRIQRPKRYQRHGVSESDNHSSVSSMSSQRSFLPAYDTHGANDNIDRNRQRRSVNQRSMTRNIPGSTFNDRPSRNGKSPRSSRIFSDNGYRKGSGSTSKSKIIIIAVAAVLIIILAIILASYISSCAKRNTDTTTPVASTTKVDTTTTETQTGTTTTSTTATTPLSVTFTIADGASSNVEVTVDSLEAYNGDVVGPLTQTYEVSTAVSMAFSQPSAASVTCNGNAVTITVGDDGVGRVDLTTATYGKTQTTTGTQTTGSA